MREILSSYPQVEGADHPPCWSEFLIIQMIFALNRQAASSRLEPQPAHKWLPLPVTNGPWDYGGWFSFHIPASQWQYRAASTPVGSFRPCRVDSSNLGSSPLKRHPHGTEEVSENKGSVPKKI